MCQAGGRQRVQFTVDLDVMHRTLDMVLWAKGSHGRFTGRRPGHSFRTGLWLRSARETGSDDSGLQQQEEHFWTAQMAVATGLLGEGKGYERKEQNARTWLY